MEANRAQLQNLSKDELISMLMKLTAHSEPATPTSALFADLELPEDNTILLDGKSLTPEQLVIIGYHYNIHMII